GSWFLTARGSALAPRSVSAAEKRLLLVVGSPALCRALGAVSQESHSRARVPDDREIRAQRAEGKTRRHDLRFSLGRPLAQDGVGVEKLQSRGFRPIGVPCRSEDSAEHRRPIVQQWKPGVMLDWEPPVGHGNEDRAGNPQMLADEPLALLATAYVLEDRIRACDV